MNVPCADLLLNKIVELMWYAINATHKNSKSISMIWDHKNKIYFVKSVSFRDIRKERWALIEGLIKYFDQIIQ